MHSPERAFVRSAAALRIGTYNGASKPTATGPCEIRSEISSMASSRSVPEAGLEPTIAQPRFLPGFPMSITATCIGSPMSRDGCSTQPVNTMKQSRTMSLVEAIANVAVGYGIAVLTQILIFPVFGLHTTLAQNLKMGAVFTVVSIARSFALRRLFEAIRVRGTR